MYRASFIILIIVAIRCTVILWKYITQQSLCVSYNPICFDTFVLSSGRSDVY